jgi:hypothetical protein
MAKWSQRRLLHNSLKCSLTMIDAIVAWDMEDDPHGNVQHVADNGVTIDEVEEVLLNENNPVGESRSSGRPSRLAPHRQANELLSSGSKPSTSISHSKSPG